MSSPGSSRGAEDTGLGGCLRNAAVRICSTDRARLMAALTAAHFDDWGRPTCGHPRCQSPIEVRTLEKRVMYCTGCALFFEVACGQWEHRCSAIERVYSVGDRMPSWQLFDVTHNLHYICDPYRRHLIREETPTEDELKREAKVRVMKFLNGELSADWIVETSYEEVYTSEEEVDAAPSLVVVDSANGSPVSSRRSIRRAGVTRAGASFRTDTMVLFVIAETTTEPCMPDQSLSTLSGGEPVGRQAREGLGAIRRVVRSTVDSHVDAEGRPSAVTGDPCVEQEDSAS